MATAKGSVLRHHEANKSNWSTAGWKSMDTNPWNSGQYGSLTSTSTRHRVCFEVQMPTFSGKATKVTFKFRGAKGKKTAATTYANIHPSFNEFNASDYGYTDDVYETYAVSGSGTGSTDFDFGNNGVFGQCSIDIPLNGNITSGGKYYIYLYLKTTSAVYRIAQGSSYYSLTLTYSPAYTVSYNANGGTGAPSSQIKYEGETLTLSSTKPTKADSTNTVTGSFDITGDAYGGYFGTTTTTTTKITASTSRTDTIKYSFSKWNTASNGSGDSYDAGANYTANAAATLYAQYISSTDTGTTTYSNNSISGLTKPSRNKTTQATYTITYVYNNGSSDSTVTCKKTRTYSFKGWSETKGGAILSNSTTYTSAKTVYASWGQSDSTQSTTLPTPTKTGYTFMGWSTNQNATSGSTGSYTPTDNVTLYAIWKANGAVRIYIDGQGYRMAQVYLFTTSDNKWHLTIPYLYDGSWHISS